MTRAETDRDTARREAGAAREEAATLRGQLDATRTQQATLMAALGQGAGGAGTTDLASPLTPPTPKRGR